MAGSKFDSKSFNPQAFGAYIDRVPQLKTNALLKSGALTGNSQISSLFKNQTGSYYGVIPMYGLIGGEALNYDGETDITATSTKTYERGVVTFGRSKAWTEKDFSQDITGGVSFMSNVAAQVAQYWDEQNQTTLLSVLKGIFSMTGTGNEDFVKAHTYDITEKEGVVGATTLNNAIQQACGANKNIFTMVIMHSAIATGLENMRLVDYGKYTDAQGVQRDLALATWNGRQIIIDDDMPVDDDKYTTYVLGRGAVDYVDLGAKVPYEMSRDPKTAGGLDILYTRQRKCFAPYGISYTKQAQATLSPTNDELATGVNWTLVSDADESFINHKAIPICRIISLAEPKASEAV